MRKRRAVKRDVLPDPIYNSKIVTKLINQVMKDGKKGTAQKIVYGAFDLIKEKTGEDAMTIFETIKVYRDVDMLVFGGTVDIPLDKRISKEEAEKLIEPYKGKVDGGFKNFCKTYYQAIIKSYEEGYVDVPAKQIRQTIIRIGDVAFVSTPFELFTEIGMRIDAYCGDIPYVLSLSYANGSELYFATEDQICRGGYEVNMHKMSGIQQYSKDADYALICGTLENLKKLSKGN